MPLNLCILILNCDSIDKDMEKCIILKVNKGLLQGCDLSPILFDLYINKGLEIWSTYSPKGIQLTLCCLWIIKLY